MSSPFQYTTVVSDFAGNAYYEAPPGIMRGGPQFTAAAMFLCGGVQEGVDQYIFANRDGANNRGWAIGMRGTAPVGDEGPPPQLFVQVGDGASMNEQTFDLPGARTKLIHVWLVHGLTGNIAVAINGTVRLTGVPVAAVASTLAATVGAREGGADPASLCPIVGVGYLNSVSLEENLALHLTGCRRNYSFIDFGQAFFTLPSWTHWYTSRDAAVPGGAGTFNGPLLTSLPQAANPWPAGRGNGLVPDVEPREPLTLTGGNPSFPIAAADGNFLWAPPL